MNHTESRSGKIVSIVGTALHSLRSSDQTPLALLAIGAVLLFCVISIAVLAKYTNNCQDPPEHRVLPPMVNDALKSDSHRSPLQIPTNFTPQTTPSVRSISNSQLPRSPAPLKKVIDQPPSSHTSGSKYLCPELVVPQDGECCLLLPKAPLHILQALRSGTVMALPAARSEFKLPIVDMKGVTVLQAIFKLSSSASQSNNDNRETSSIVLCSPTEEHHFLAQIRETRNVEPSVLTLHDHKCTLFGSLRAEIGDRGSGYIHSACDGSRLHFSGDFKFDSLHESSIQAQGLVFDENQELRAFVKPRLLDESSRSVRFGPGVDVGCVLLCLLGIDVLEL